MQDKHSEYGPSLSKRRLSCPGSLRLERQTPPAKRSEFAQEGTSAHKLAELCLTQNAKPEFYLGKTLEDVLVTSDMADAVQVYLDYVQSLVSQQDIDMKLKILKVEEHFDLAWLFPDTFGTNDCYVYDIKAKKLYVIDYKHGVGISVNPEWNSQLLMYALGAMHNIWSAQSEKSKTHFTAMDLIKEIELVIVQPRIQFKEEIIKRWKISSSDLMYWALHVLVPGLKATQKEDAPLCVGEHCKFCKALAICPEQLKNTMALAKVDFERLQAPDPRTLKPEELLKVVELSGVISSWAKEVKAYAQSQMQAGITYPGFKLVQSRTTRKWVDSFDAENLLTQLLGEEAYEKKIISVAKAEKILDKLGFPVELTLEDLWDKSPGEAVMVSEDDRRVAILPSSTMDFLEEADFLQ